MIETVDMMADVDDIKEVERLLSRCGKYISAGYELTNFTGNEKVVKASFQCKAPPKKRRIGFTNE